ncbi:uncharacterized protein LOC135825632 [Sycon ciliatum]|uniref:uncharacterized protein LOC135825632 n=1 Tax=Sycon ciliatum TaxID=27933 RepID=UPI0031F61083
MIVYILSGCRSTDAQPYLGSFALRGAMSLIRLCAASSSCRLALRGVRPGSSEAAHTASEDTATEASTQVPAPEAKAPKSKSRLNRDVGDIIAKSRGHDYKQTSGDTSKVEEAADLEAKDDTEAETKKNLERAQSNTYIRRPHNERRQFLRKSWSTEGLLNYSTRDACMSHQGYQGVQLMYSHLTLISNDTERYNMQNTKPIDVTLNGRTYSFRSYWDSPVSIGNALAHRAKNEAVCARFNGKLINLQQPLTSSGDLEYIMPDAPDAARALGGLGCVLLNQALERSWPDAKLLSSGVNHLGQFYCDISRHPALIGLPDSETLAILENYMLEVASLPYNCEMLRAPQSSYAKSLASIITSLFQRYDQERGARILQAIEGDSLSPLYIHGLYMNVHESPVAPFPSFVKGVVIESIERRYNSVTGDDECTCFRLTGRIFPSVEKLHEWMLESYEFRDDVQKDNPSCRHARWAQVPDEARRPLERTPELEQAWVQQYQHDLEKDTEVVKAKRGSKQTTMRRQNRTFTALHNSYITIAHPLTHNTPPDLETMEKVRLENPSLFKGVLYQAKHLVSQWEVLRRNEGQRIAMNAEANLYEYKRVMLARPSDIGSKRRPALSRSGRPEAMSLSVSLD